MTLRSSKFPIIFTSLALCMLPCSAQNAAKVSLRFLSFPKAMEPMKVELRLTEGKTLDVEAPSNEFSQPVKVDALGEWSVGTSRQPRMR